MSEIEELSARVAKLESWVEVVMRTLAGMQVEPGPYRRSPELSGRMTLSARFGSTPQ
jgi:hypothetical protein